MTNLFSIYDHQEVLIDLINKKSWIRVAKSLNNTLRVWVLGDNTDNFFIPAEHLDKLLSYKSIHHLYKYAKRFELPNTKERFNAHIDHLIALDKAHKAQSQSNLKDKPQSDEQDGTVVVVIAKDNKTLAKVGFHPPLAGSPVCRPSTSPLLGRGDSFLHNELNKGKKRHGNNNGLQKVHGFPAGSSPSHFLVTKNHGNKNSKTKYQQQGKFLERFYHSSL